ncbi:uncharacterized protein E0L32_012101 [Thyridium curvatum]|uniref:Secreted protein n=1 Tax=Thyridium curvatum TaxID=1093900 RepID=A0A507BKH0_9PEZI|nr:uncharacterized protein E0L32_012101 [Thyridium curvatum]TPX17591.1 hypothetical protein E0L32_012101 [Thyridium curvatum]
MRSVAFLLPALVAAAPGLVFPPGGSPDGTADNPDPNDIQIISTSFSGNGCPQGSVSTTISPDKTSKVVTFGFDKFQTYIGPGYDPTTKTKNCQLHLNLRYPGGFQFAVVDSTYHGYAQLDPGVTGTFYSTYYFSQDASATTTTRTSITGGGIWADGQVYTKNDQVPTASYIYSPCGANGILNVNNRISLTSSNSSAVGEITNDDATVAFTQQVHLSWSRCRK